MASGGSKAFPKPDFVSICCTSLTKAFKTGKEDHYYILAIRSLIYACCCFLAWPGILLGIAAVVNAKKAQELDIQGNLTGAEKKATLARRLIICSYIISSAYFVLTTIVLVVMAYAVSRAATYAAYST